MENLISIDVSYLPKVCFALQQNAIPLIRQVSVKNESDAELEDVQCCITSTPSFFPDYQRHFSSLAPGKEYTITDLDTPLNYKMLSEISEKVRGDFQVQLFNNQGETIRSERFAVEVLPYDVWPGGEIIPELLAAYVTPNNDAVEDIMVRAGSLLQTRTGSGGLSGYQSKDKRYVYEMIRAAFDGVKQIGITYSNPAANFEKNGQRVRFPQKIHESHLATCLDSALLFAGVLEQCGLHPLVLLHEGHVYAGCHLIEESFPNPIVDDLQSVRKRSQLDELIVFETTMIADGGRTSFDDAVAKADFHLNLDSVFHFALDVASARETGIVPLPILRGELDLSNKAQAKKTDGATSLRAASRKFTEAIVVDKDTEMPQTRIDSWKRHLLDMTLRNRLLNFRENKQTVPVACPTPGLLEDALAGEREFKLLDIPSLMAEGDPRSQGLMEENALDKYLQDELGLGRLRCNLTEAELSKRLLALFRASRTDLEEGGVNTLFLTLGFLQWVDPGGETRKAPLIMLPVRIERKSVRHGFKLQRYDDDVAVNVTLLEMLLRDFRLEVLGVDPPPQDELGVDVARILQLFRQAVKSMKGWEVKNEVWLARFSFSKFIMWKDLNNRLEDLTSNPVVNHLVNNPGDAFDNGIEGVTPENIDRDFGFEHLFCPMSADSSQLAAVLSVEKGKSFVLHGPPGTGKSQTITNMIAHCLTMGKRILFVSEKRAALEVVHKRLCKIGLEPFCLELHSNKSGKMDVLRQFKQVLDFGFLATPDEWAETAQRLNVLREKLNVYQTELHRIYPCGLTPYKAFSFLLGNDKHPQLDSVPALDLNKPETMTRQALNDCLDICKKLELRSHELSQDSFGNLAFIQTRQWTPVWQRDFLAHMSELSEQFQQLQTSLSDFERICRWDIDIDSEEIVGKVLDLAKMLIAAPDVPAGFISFGWEEFSENITTVIEAGRLRDELEESLPDFKDSVWTEISVDSLIHKFDASEKKFFILRLFDRLSVKKTLQQCQKIGAIKIPFGKVRKKLAVIKKIQTVQETVDDLTISDKERLGSYWSGDKKDWDKIEFVLAFGNKINDLVGAIEALSPQTGAAIRHKAGMLIESKDVSLAENGEYAQKVAALSGTWGKCVEALSRIREVGGTDGNQWGKSSNLVNEVLTACTTVEGFKEYLRSWCMWLQAKDEAAQNGLTNLIPAIESGTLTHDVQGLFKHLFQTEFIDRIITNVAVLRDFIGDEHDSIVENFKNLDNRYAELTAKLVVTALASHLPGARKREAAKGSAIGLLQRECQKKSRHLPVRVLLEKVQSVLPSLKPCMLMSPLSIAQYLPTNQGNFDIVIFDEASQIPVWDAIGAIARAPQCVIVGDPKQLPPTNFFNRSDSDDDFVYEDEDFAELESILDECIASRMEDYHLRWHYRSRHESLISFSNYHYYDNRLYTFPSAVGEGVGTKFLFAAGTYDKGKSRTNKVEAEALVKEVVARLTDPGQCHRSIGIVTFSQAQQSLIEDLLDVARNDTPEIETFFTDEVPEPVFVKNLENVQGDERDIILFSICYAKDQTGRLSMNFGPLNRDGGERRLNVAITRAREVVVVFSSIRAEDIDLSRTKSLGVTHLKSYLKYAENGIQAFGNITASPVETDDFESPFEKEVAKYLKSAGYSVHTQVGCSGYRIDLAIPHPDKPGLYILGVECDGAAYHSSATAQDRDQLRQSVLENLGWKIHRVWSTAWWHRPKKTKSKLLESVKDALYEAENCSEDNHFGRTNAESSASSAMTFKSLVEEKESETKAPKSMEDHALSAEYPSTQYPYLSSTSENPERFLLPQSRKEIITQIEAVIDREAPIYRNVLYRRVADLWGINRVTLKIRAVFEDVLPPNLSREVVDENDVFWGKLKQSGGDKYFRYPNKNENYRRLLDEVPIEELANAMYFVMCEYHSCKTVALYRETAAIFGILRVTKKSEEFLKEALLNLKERGLVE